MSEPKNASQLAALAELAEHLHVLESEVRHVTRRAKALLEECWMLRHTDIYPQLCAWKESTSSADFLTFSVQKSKLHFEQLLSTQELSKAPEILDPSQSAAPLVAFALASQEMQFDFIRGVTVLPLSFFDQVVGIVVSHNPSLTVAHYEKVVSESTALLVSLRRVVMSGRLSHLQNLARAS